MKSNECAFTFTSKDYLLCLVVRPQFSLNWSFDYCEKMHNLKS